MENYCYGWKHGLLCHKYGGVCKYCIKSVKITPKIYDGYGDSDYDDGY